MRIISGIHKGRRLTAPKNLPVRPTTDMAKEALFNILNNTYYFDDISVIDLFSGTGNISFEFSSRGVEQIIAVDNNSKCIHFIEKTKEDELRKQEMDEKKESETIETRETAEQEEIDGQLFLAGCNRLHTLHGEKKIEEALRIFGLDESGSAADLIEHVLGLTIAPFEIELEEEEQKSVVDEL